jgi:hypothetical protein
VKLDRYDLASWCRFVSVATGAANLATWAMALLGVYLWGPRLLAWAFLVIILWALFIGGPLALLAWVLSRDSWGDGSL